MQLYGALILLMLSILSTSCDPQKVPITQETLPHGGGFYLDRDDILKTHLSPLDYLTHGATVELNPLKLTGREGYEVDLLEGQSFNLTLSALNFEVTVALYGPRNAYGLWGEVLSSTQGGANGSLSVTQEATTTGTFFLLIVPSGTSDQPIDVSWECEGCDAECEGPTPCDLYCPDQYLSTSSDPQSFLETCRPCECNVSLCTPQCSNAERCVNGECERTCESQCPSIRESVCGADGQNYPNRCYAECSEVSYVFGACDGPPPCMEGRCPLRNQCRGGVCEPVECNCGSSRNQVCSTSGQTFPNLCELECVEATLAYTGGCRSVACDVNSPCEGEREVCGFDLNRHNSMACLEGGDCPLGCLVDLQKTCTFARRGCPQNTQCLFNIVEPDEGEVDEDAISVCAPICSMEGRACPKEASYCHPTLNLCLSLCDREANQCNHDAICAPINDPQVSTRVGVCLPSPL